MFEKVIRISILLLVVLVIAFWVLALLPVARMAIGNFVLALTAILPLVVVILIFAYN